MSSTVQHDPAAKRFSVKNGDEELGFLSYLEDETSLTIDHTVVHPAHRGKGIAGTLVEHALDWVRHEHGKRLVPQCPYVRSYIAKHPEHAPLTER